MEMNTYDVYEWCPYCEAENEYLNVPEGTMISNCKTCGRPLVLCDKCYSMYGSEGRRNCGSCKWEKKAKKMMKEWEKEQIGKIVYWKDPDDDLCSDYCKVIGFNDGVYVLRHIFDGDGEIEAFDSELDFFDEEKQIEIYMNVFRHHNYRLGFIKI